MGRGLTNPFKGKLGYFLAAFLSMGFGYFLAVLPHPGRHTILRVDSIYLPSTCPANSVNCDGENFDCPEGFVKTRVACYKPEMSFADFFALNGTVHKAIESGCRAVADLGVQSHDDDVIAAVESTGEWRVSKGQIVPVSLNHPLFLVGPVVCFCVSLFCCFKLIE